MDGIGDLLFAIALVLVVIFIIMLFLIDNNKLFHNILDTVCKLHVNV